VSVEPPRPTAPPAAGGASPPTQPVAVREAPSGLRDVAPGPLLSATVVGRNGQGHLMLRTPNGMLALATAANPPAGSTVTLQLRPAGAQMQAYILNVRPPDAGPAFQPAARPAGAPAAPLAGDGHTAPPVTDHLSRGAPLRVVVHAGPAGAPPAAANGAALPRLVPGDAVNVQLLRVQPPDAQPGQPAGRLGGGDGIARPIQAVGRVLPDDGAGGTLLRTPLGTLRLPLSTPPAPGTQITLKLTLPVRPGAPAAADAGPKLAAPTLTRAWPALQDALATVQRPGRVPDEAARTAALTSPGNPVAQALPRPGPALGSGLLFLMAALKGGDISRWLGGEPLRALERAARGDLVGRLRGDFQQLSRLAQDAGGDWRLFALPVIGDGDVRPVRLYLRRHDGDEDAARAGAEEPPPGRVLVELTLSRLGELQLDGLARRRRLDAILRSRAPLPDELRREIARVFHETLAAAGGTGDLRFEADAAWSFLDFPEGEEMHTGFSA
jgi:hypothetical protein